jgi:GNAT superfamily N-acetyltransferase
MLDTRRLVIIAAGVLKTVCGIGGGREMSPQAKSPPDLEFQPVTPERWQDLEALFGQHGAYGGCWCMWWRLRRSEFAKQIGQGNKESLKRIVDAGEVPGLLAYAHGQPVAWCSVAPRETFPALERSRILKRVDDKPVWSIVCFFVAKSARRRGVMLRLLAAAVEYAGVHGAQVVEGYPVEPTRTLSGASGFTGVVSTFRQAGFVEVLRRSKSQAIMRCFVGKQQ